MSYRIDKITISLDVAVEFDGRHQVTFDVTPAADPALTAAVETAWHRANDALLVEAMNQGGNPMGAPV
jgi:hypothetical protein